MTHVAQYCVGRLSARSFRCILDDAKMRGLLTYAETKGILDSVFHVRASAEVHQKIRESIRRATGR